MTDTDLSCIFTGSFCYATLSIIEAKGTSHYGSTNGKTLEFSSPSKSASVRLFHGGTNI